MAKDYFVISKGLSIDGSTIILYGSANPSQGGGVVAAISSVYCQTSDGSTWHKTGAGDTAWTKFMDASGASIEDADQNSFMGKTSTGAVLPDYTEENHIATDDSLEEAIDKIDMYLGAVPTVNTRTNNPIIALNDVNANIEALDDAIGSNANITSNYYITSTGPILADLSALDAAIYNKNPYAKLAANQNPGSGLTVDSVAVASYSTVEWLLTLESYATPANKIVYKIIALNDNSTNVDYTEFAILTVGAAISGLVVEVDYNTGNMRLRVTASENINYRLQRIVQA